MTSCSSFVLHLHRDLESEGLIFLICAAVFFSSGCKSEKDPCGGEPLYYQAPDDDRYLGLDEAWIALRDAIDRGVDVDDAAGPRITAPPDGGTVSLDGWEYGWEIPIARRPPLRRPRRLSGPRPPGSGIGERVIAFLSPFGTAHAHGAPVTGDTYLVELFIPEEECPVKVLTVADGWPVDEATKGRVTAAASIETQLTWAYLQGGIVSEGPARRPARHTVMVEP